MLAVFILLLLLFVYHCPWSLISTSNKRKHSLSVTVISVGIELQSITVTNFMLASFLHYTGKLRPMRLLFGLARAYATDLDFGDWSIGEALWRWVWGEVAFSHLSRGPAAASQDLWLKIDLEPSDFEIWPLVVLAFSWLLESEKQLYTVNQKKTWQFIFEYNFG